ncbi:TRAP transporter substrate-binding protein [Acuticoccus sp. MNP-M23]|uniref:TRAP transporter substrate-binding protein n=1 Tax=Acuticoccus sp. MNP-M23 TaxID=3072793 RepID=UPI002815357F|nr:TRAP transporter substrate-binding protein [Acuticoccus sp. MNP-M23]WMS42052.1 TRAP transporter substrate-binding protein [Acuticoccus sp. MNP-M23]
MIRLAAVLCALCLLPALPARAQDPITLTSQYGPGKPQTLFWEHFAARLEEERPGRFAPRIVIGGALGGEKEEAEGVRLGSITGALSTVANLTTWVPLGAVLDLPFEFEDADHIKRTLAGPLGAVLKEQYRAQGFEVPAFIIFGARHLLGKNEVSVPADIKGVTMRVLESDLHVALWRSLGAAPTALPITEAYGALSNGVVGAMDMTKSGYEALKLYEVAPVLSQTAHIWAIGVVYFDARWWDGLADEDRAAVREAALEAADYFNDIAAKEQDAAMMRTAEKGARLVTVDQAPWRAALGDFAAEYAAALDDPLAVEALAAIENAR